MQALREEEMGEVSFVGCGGPLMAAAGLNSVFPIEPFSVMGPIAALGALPAALMGADKLEQLAVWQNVDAAIFIDSWAFSRMAAKRIRRAAPEVRLFKFAAPQVWASRPKRAETAAELFDGILTLFEFEPPWFEKVGARAAFVGHPVFQKAIRQGTDGAAFRERHGLGDALTLAVLPGSRRGEIRRLLPPFELTVRALAERHAGLRIVTALPPNVEEEARAIMSDWPGEPVFAAQAEKYDAFAAADAALAASGTVTTELAIQGTPMAVAYKVHPINAWWGRRIITAPYVSLVNIAEKREIAPEFIQEACEPKILTDVLSLLLTDENARDKQKSAFPGALDKLGARGAPAAKRAASLVFQWMREPRRKLPIESRLPSA